MAQSRKHTAVYLWRLLSLASLFDVCKCPYTFYSKDRICIHNGQNVTLSAEDIISCHIDENMSCQGIYHRMPLNALNS